MFCYFIPLLLLILAGCSSLYTPQERADLPVYTPQKPIRIALVLGGGGSRGLAHLGALQELRAAGIQPDLIVGCSAGSIIGAFYADNPELNGLASLFLPLKRRDLLDLSFGVRFGLAKGKSLETFLQKHTQAQTFEELKIPLIVIATDLFTGELVELSQGKLPPAVAASCAFPGLFKPVLLYGRYLVDGGVCDPVPVEIAKKYGAQVVIAIDVSGKLCTDKPKHFLGVAKRSLEISYLKRVDLSLAKADVAVKMDFDGVEMLSDGFNEHLYETGRLKMREKIPAIQKSLESTLALNEEFFPLE